MNMHGHGARGAKVHVIASYIENKGTDAIYYIYIYIYNIYICRGHILNIISIYLR